MQKQIFLIKRDGTKELQDIEKFHAAIAHACDGISDVSISDIAMNCQIQFYDGMKTTEVDNIVIKSMVDLISESKPNYQFVAAKYAMMQLRKDVYGKFEPDSVYDVVKRNVAKGLYTDELLKWYSEDEYKQLEKIIRHKRDFNFAYAGVQQLIGKYLVQDRSTNKIFETPQIAYLLIAATIKNNYPKETRLKEIKDFYELISKHSISLPTPIMTGVRTSTKQFSSCVLIESSDDLDSINATASSIVKYVSKRAGIGIGAGSIRALGSKIRSGEVKHTGVIPFYKLFQSAVKSCSQGGVRGGAATLSVPIWHLEIEEILPLKNNKGVEDNRVRRIDYCIQFNTYLIKRALQKQSITLFSPSDVPGLYDAFFDQTDEEFIKLYEKYENDPKIRKKSVDAMQLVIQFLTERAETGRIYSSLVDEVNRRSPFLKPVKMTNLCVTGDTIITIGDDEYGIRDIRIDELQNTDYKKLKVFSRNIKTGIDEFKPIIEFALTSKNAELLEIIDEQTGYKLICTPEHKIYTTNRGYVEAHHLLETDSLQLLHHR